MNRDATFKIVISLVIDGNEFQFKGEVEGQIIPEKWGGKVWVRSYFLADGYESFAQMRREEKSAISRRGIAVKKLTNS